GAEEGERGACYVVRGTCCVIRRRAASDRLHGEGEGEHSRCYRHAVEAGHRPRHVRPLGEDGREADAQRTQREGEISSQSLVLQSGSGCGYGHNYELRITNYELRIMNG